MFQPMPSAFALLTGLALSAVAAAQTSTPSRPSGATSTTTAPVRSSADPRRETIARMGKVMSLDVNDSRLEDVMTFIKETTQADLEFLWVTDGDNSAGMDKEKKLTLAVKNRPALAVLEAVLEKAKGEFGSGNQWQMSSYGTMQIGPKEALNKFRRLETYDINDLLTVIPRYADVPEIDLNSVLQQSQGGGGGQSPFNQVNQQNDPVKPREDRAKDVVDILLANVESEQWTDNVGEAATIRYYGGTLIVNAPDYVHRGISGYSYWPSYTVGKSSNGRRYLTLNADTGVSRIDGFGQQPVSAVVGGRVISSGNPGGGGLKVPPPGKR